MAYKLIWTENAKSGLLNIVQYLEEEWSLRIAENFVIELYLILDLISNSPLIGIVSEKNILVRKIFVTKHNALYYMIEGENVFLLDFFDTRQHPNKSTY
ncbi:MAG: type II toxin-antitoxin system RelE/ParE family toxin [Bacteroidia bacterium]